MYHGMCYIIPAMEHTDAYATIRPWVVLADATLTAIERTAWDIRQAAEETRAALVMGATAQQDTLRDTTRRTQRLLRAGYDLGRIAGSYRLHRTRAALTTKKSAARALERLHLKNALRARALGEDLGGALLKVGQLLSARPDLLPRSYVDQLSHLQDAAPTEPFETIRAIVERELDGPLDTFFHSFDETPIAAASIGQVHRARAKVPGVPEGVDVAVKVQRPAIGTKVSDDLLLLGYFLDALGSELPPTDLDTIRQEIAEAVEAELDYVQERLAMQAHRDFFADDPHVIVPEPLPSHCSPQVLTATFIESRKITDVLSATDDDAVRSRLLGALLDTYVRLVTDAGFFQADPHPGNLRVTEEGQLVLLDFGCTAQLDRERRDLYVRVLQAALVDDGEGLARHLGALGFETRSGDTAGLVEMARSLLTEVRAAMVPGEGPRWRTREELFAEARRAMELASEDPVMKVPADFVLLARVFGTLGGLYLEYRPGDVASHLQRTAMRLMT